MKIGKLNISVFVGTWFEFGIVWDYKKIRYAEYSLLPRLIQISLGCFAIRLTWGEK